MPWDDVAEPHFENGTAANLNHLDSCIEGLCHDDTNGIRCAPSPILSKTEHYFYILSCFSFLLVDATMEL